jgi:hypothetical protein
MLEKKIDLEKLQEAVNNLVMNAEKSNKGNKAAGRRFRVGSFELQSLLKEMRKHSA